MKISKITTQKNRNDRFNIFTNENGYEEYAFSVDENVLVKFQLKKGSIITKSEKAEILQADQQRKAFNDAIYYLTHSMRTEYQIKQYLIKKEYNVGVIEEAIRKMKEYHYIDDEEFAMAFVRTKIKTTDKGPSIIKEELFQKGISSETAEKALLQFTFQAQLEAAQTFLQKKGKQKQNESASNMKKRLLNRLIQKGYSLETALQAWENEHLEVSQEEELKALWMQGEKAKKKLKNKHTGKNLELKIKEFLYRKGFPIHLIDNYLQETDLLEDENGGKKI